MSDPFWIVQKRPRAEGSIKEAKAKLPALMRHRHVGFDGDRFDWQSVRCPYHMDSHASASLNLSALRFNCHACGVAGDALDLAMTQENMDWQEAMSWLMGL